jgi:O-antigen/teichoic acid export membrane protein
MVLALLTLVIFFGISFYIMDKLKIHSLSSGYILASLLALSWIIPVLMGGLQGLELFIWFTSISVLEGIVKLILCFLFILKGFRITGALGALLISSIISTFFCYLPLKRFFSFAGQKKAGMVEKIDSREVLFYLFPVVISTFCFAVLVNSDLVLVKYFFNPEEAGLYSISQMVGKIFLFLPGAISIVMFPKTSGLNAKNKDTAHTLNKSLMYASGLCAITMIGYNAFPSLVLTILTGKAFAVSINLGRMFSISMTFFALLFILISYFLSIKDFRFIKYLVLFTLLQVLTIALLHNNLFQVQSALCVNSCLLFLIHLSLSLSKLRYQAAV